MILLDYADTITVNWADPVPEPDDETMKEVKTLYHKIIVHIIIYSFPFFFFK